MLMTIFTCFPYNRYFQDSLANSDLRLPESPPTSRTQTNSSLSHGQGVGQANSIASTSSSTTNPSSTTSVSTSAANSGKSKLQGSHFALFFFKNHVINFDQH